jgi:PPOX class probable F420-dependent enzyme
MRLERGECRTRLAAAPIARLATVTPEGRPHVVPICFVLVGNTIYSAVDSKPKSSPVLQRFANVVVTPHAAVLVDHYDADWTQLWWIRADGDARPIADPNERTNAIAELRAKYPQYRDHALEDAVLSLVVRAWTGWAAGPRPAPER